MSRMNRKERRNLLMRVGAVLIAICMIAALALPALAAETSSDDEPYAYTVRIFPGDKGTIDGSEDPFIKEVEAGYQWGRNDFDCLNQAAVKDEYQYKYYVTGMRESGRDNNTNVNYKAGDFTVDRDIDLVVSYGIRGSDVEYTINYVEVGTNKVLHKPETYHGNVGDQPAVAYLYIENYIPQYKKMTGTLQKDATKNSWTFYYVSDQDSSVTTSSNSTKTGAATGKDGSGTTTQAGTGANSDGVTTQGATGTASGVGGSIGTSSTGAGSSVGTGGSSTGTGTSTGAGTGTGTGTGTGAAAGTGTGTGTAAGTGTGTGTAAGTGTGTGTGTAPTGTVAANTGTVNTRANGPVEIVNVDETETPLVEYVAGDEDSKVEPADNTEKEIVNNETEGVVRKSSASPAKIVIGALIVLVVAGGFWFFLKRNME